MGDYLTASEARKLSDNSVEESLFPILQEIENAAREGKIAVRFYSAISDRTHERLQELGYAVNKVDSWAGDEYYISWGE
jgi:hypothetical protein